MKRKQFKQKLKNFKNNLKYYKTNKAVKINSSPYFIIQVLHYQSNASAYVMYL